MRKWSWTKILGVWKKRVDGYKNLNSYFHWFLDRVDRIRDLFLDPHVKSIVFGEFKSIFDSFSAKTEDQVRATITQVAFANAVMGSLPGKMGVGVFVSMALEAWMAFRIGTLIGIKDLNKSSDVLKYLGLLTGIVTVIGWGFVHILRFVFSLLSSIPGLPVMFTAELLVTNFVGTLFWLGFDEARDKGSFAVPPRMWLKARRLTWDLYSYQYRTIKELVKTTTDKNWFKSIGERAWGWLSGDFVIPSKEFIRAELFLVGSLSALLQKDFGKLDGPLGEVFLQSIRDRWSTTLGNASVEEIADFMSNYEPYQMAGVANLIKGKMFEHLVMIAENTDGDQWEAHLHEDETWPGSDIIFTSLETGEQVEVSLKALEGTISGKALLEKALLKYPDIPISATSEVAELINDPRVTGIPISNEALTTDVEEMLSSLSLGTGRIQTMVGVAAGTSAGAILQLWPYVIAYQREKITKKELEVAFRSVIGDQGKRLAGRVVLALLLGPVYAWYLLAVGVMRFTPGALSLVPDNEKLGGPVTDKPHSHGPRRLAFKPPLSFTN